MAKGFILFIIALIILPVAFFGCKSRVDKSQDITTMETTAVTPSQEEMGSAQPLEPAMMEPIPPTAAPQVAARGALPSDKSARNKDIQLALSKAGFYQGPVDGKIGPKTKRAIEAFQKEKGLKVDGKVGPRTWAELEKHLAQ